MKQNQRDATRLLLSLNQDGRIPPQATEVEVQVLGALLVDPEAIARIVDDIAEDDFHMDYHRKIYRAMVELHSKGIPIDTITLSEELRADGNLELVGGEVYLVELSIKVTHAANIEHHAAILKEYGTRRRLIQASQLALSRAYDLSEDLGEFLPEVEKSFIDLTGITSRTKPQQIGKLLPALVEQIDEMQHGDREVWGIHTGFSELDRVMGGYEPGTLTIIGGRPSQGKSAMMMSGAIRQAKKGIPVCIFSVEMSNTQNLLRCLSQESGIHAWMFKSKKRLTDSDWTLLTAAAGDLSGLPIYIDPDPSLTLPAFKAKTRRMKSDHGVEVVYADYIQIMKMPKADTRDLAIGMVTGGMKELGKELNIPVIALAQLSKKVEDRPNKRPILSDLRESGNIEQDADNIIFVTRAESYGFKKLADKHTDSAGLGEAIVAKHKNGPPGDIILRFHGPTMCWSDYNPNEEPKKEEQRNLPF